MILSLRGFQQPDVCTSQLPPASWVSTFTEDWMAWQPDTKTRGNFWKRISTIHEHVRIFSKRGWLWPLSVCLDVTSPDVFDLSGRNSLDYWDASCAPTKSQRNCDSASHASFTMLIYSHLEKIHQRVKGVLISRVPHKIKKGVFCLVTVCGRENCPSSSMIYQMIGNADVP